MIDLTTDGRDHHVYTRAVCEARRDIRRDIDAATSGAVATFLALTCRSFLDDDANASTIMRAAAISRNDLHPQFHIQLGTTPWRYIRAKRFDVAQRLLEDTDMPVWKVGYLVGYPQPQTFGRAFRSIVGVAPETERRRLRRASSVT